MSNEITTEVLAKGIDATKREVQDKKIGSTVTLDIGDKKQDYQLINKSASDTKNQLNAMAIAPVVNGKPDYNNVAVVYAGTNTWGETGRDGFGTAIGAAMGDLSGEYKLAEAFLKQTQKKVAQNNGKITDVAGFSQSGGYMMKMAGQYGKEFGFKTTSFDDWGNEQIKTLTKSEQEWIKNNPELLLRYQNDSWANYSQRDHKYGNVQGITGIGEHNTLSKYFNGGLLDLDLLAKNGIFAPHMTKEQVKTAAKNWAKKHGDCNPFTDDEDEANDRVKEYLKLYGTYATKDFGVQMKKLNRIKAILFSSGGGLSSNEKRYLDSEAARIIVQKLSSDFKLATENLIKLYQDAIVEAQELWQKTLNEARSIGFLLNEWEVVESLHRVGFTEHAIVTTPCNKYQNKINKILAIASDFDTLTHEIEAKITEIVQRDSELAQQLKGI